MFSRRRGELHLVKFGGGAQVFSVKMPVDGMSVTAMSQLKDGFAYGTVQIAGGFFVSGATGKKKQDDQGEKE